MKETTLEIQTEGLPNQSQNCRILFMARQSIFPNAVFSALRSIGRHTQLPKDKGYSLLWSPNIYLMVCGSTSPYWHLSSQRGGISQPTMKAIVTRLYDAGIVSSLDFQMLCVRFQSFFMFIEVYFTIDLSQEVFL